MKRKLLTLTLALLAVLALTVPVSADSIWTPDDTFYEKHHSDCDYVGRRYELAGYDGKVTVFTAPGGMNKATLNNGVQGTIQFTWKGKGTTWGYLCWLDSEDSTDNLQYWLTGGEVSGWVAMDDLALVYDSKEFFKDHEAEIAEAGPAEVDFHEAALYSYPNGPYEGFALEEHADYMPFSETFTQVYTDGAGLRWGYVGYYMGRRDAWVCLDDPMNEGLDGAVVPVSPSAAQTRGSATVTAGPPEMLLAGGLVAGVAAVTGVLVLKLKKRTAAA